MDRLDEIKGCARLAREAHDKKWSGPWSAGKPKPNLACPECMMHDVYVPWLISRVEAMQKVVEAARELLDDNRYNIKTSEWDALDYTLKALAQLDAEGKS